VIFDVGFYDRILFFSFLSLCLYNYKDEKIYISSPISFFLKEVRYTRKERKSEQNAYYSSQDQRHAGKGTLIRNAEPDL